MSKGLFK